MSCILDLGGMLPSYLTDYRTNCLCRWHRCWLGWDFRRRYCTFDRGGDRSEQRHPGHFADAVDRCWAGYRYIAISEPRPEFVRI